MDLEARETRCAMPIEGKTSSLIEEYLYYLGQKKNRSALTLDSYQNDLDQFAAFLAESTSADPCDTDARILSVDTDSAARFVDYLKGQYTPSTLSRKITAVRGLYGYLLSKEKLRSNPFTRVHIKPAKPASLEFLEESHLQQLFDVISGNHWLASRDRAIIAVLYCTGMRIGELLGLRVEDIEPDNAAVHIRTTGRATRVCHLAPWAWHTVERYMSRRPACLNERDVLFVNRDSKPLSARSVRRKLSEYSRRAHLPIEVTPANLRHSCAIHLLRNGADAKAVRDLLGHLSASSIRPYLNCLSDAQNQPSQQPETLEIAVS